MAAEYRDKRTLITTVRGIYLSFATFPAPLLSHCSLPLSYAFAKSCNFIVKNYQYWGRGGGAGAKFFPRSQAIRKKPQQLEN
jgi:hypothetical protein